MCVKIKCTYVDQHVTPVYHGKVCTIHVLHSGFNHFHIYDVRRVRIGIVTLNISTNQTTQCIRDSMNMHNETAIKAEQRSLMTYTVSCLDRTITIEQRLLGLWHT